MKVLIINPSRFYSGNWGSGELSHLFVLYSYLRQHCPGVEVDVLDLERELATPEDAAGEQTFLRLARAALQASDFDVVGISCWTSLHYLSTIAVANICKELNPDCTIVVGGYHPSSIPQDFAYQGTPFDYVVTGEGEEAFRRIVMGEIPKETTPQIVAGSSVDTTSQILYWQDYKYYRNAEKVQIWLTRGCPFSCGFCLDRNTKWRGHSPKRAVAEVSRAKDQLPSLEKISIMDPIFGLNKEWRRGVLDGLIAADLNVRYWAETRGDIMQEDDIAKLGALDFQMDVGLDSIAPRMIGIMMKAKNPEKYVQSFLETSRLMDKHKVTHLIYGIFNYPGETPATLQETRQFWLRYYEQRPGGYGFFLAQPFAFFPGCEVHTNFAHYEKEYGARVLCREWWRIARPSHAKRAAQVIPSRELAAAKGLFLYKEIQRTINMLATKTVNRSVVDRFRLEQVRARPTQHAPSGYMDNKRLRIGESIDYSEANGQRLLVNFDREETRVCTKTEAGWLDEILQGATIEELRARVAKRSPPADVKALGAKLNNFLELMLGLQVLVVDPPKDVELNALPDKALIETNIGTMEFQLLREEAPNTVANFVRLARSGYYHRLHIGTAVRGAFIESGSLMPRDPGPAPIFPPDQSTRPHERGTLSMNPANQAAVFTVCRAAWPDLNGVRTVFGRLVEGWEVLDQLLANDVITKISLVQGEAQLPLSGQAIEPLSSSLATPASTPRAPRLVQLGSKSDAPG